MAELTQEQFLKAVGNYTDFESNDTDMTRKNNILLQANDK
jgi:hypothetical protein